MPKRMGRVAFGACVLVFLFPAFAFHVLGWRYLSRILEVALLLSSIPRFHDIDRSGWWSLLVALPVVKYLAVAGLLYQAGTSDENQFGPVPRF